MEKESQVIFEKSVAEFVIVAAEVCRCLEQASSMRRKLFVDQTLKLLPLLYLKATLLPKCEFSGDEELETYVTEEMYESVRTDIVRLMGEKDDYLEVFLPEMTYSDQPIRQCISENLADIYQDIRNFVFVFGLGLNQTMNDSLALCMDQFGTLWGRKLVNTLRALHDAKYNTNPDEEEDSDDSMHSDNWYHGDDAFEDDFDEE